VRAPPRPPAAERPEPGGAPAGPEPADPGGGAGSGGADEVQRCDLCGAPMLEWHCRIICTYCGYQRDCSDP
jgi:hypothetical protein